MIHFFEVYSLCPSNLCSSLTDTGFKPKYILNYIVIYCEWGLGRMSGKCKVGKYVQNDTEYYYSESMSKDRRCTVLRNCSK